MPQDPALLIVAAAVAVEAVVLAFLAMSFVRHRRGNGEGDEGNPGTRAANPSEATRGDLQDVFLLHRSGLLLKHYTRRLRPNMDSDVLSGMLVAVQEFIKDSFRGEAGSLDEIRFGDMRIKVLEGKWTIIAALVRGEVKQGHTAEMTTALRDLESRYEDLLIEWDGTMDRIPEVDRIMRRLIEGGYRVSAPEVAA